MPQPCSFRAKHKAYARPYYLPNLLTVADGATDRSLTATTNATCHRNVNTTLLTLSWCNGSADTMASLAIVTRRKCLQHSDSSVASERNFFLNTRPPEKRTLHVCFAFMCSFQGSVGFESFVISVVASASWGHGGDVTCICKKLS